ncbi:MAG: hypothetical protein IPK03_10720 [Bacteroidetes bacterium]|nr:hypothetical protein [Bacteroidota bacterium]
MNLGIDIKGFIDGTSISIPSQFTTSYDISGSGFYIQTIRKSILKLPITTLRQLKPAI